MILSNRFVQDILFYSGRCQFIEDARFAPVVLFRTWLFLFRTLGFCSEPLGISGRFIQGILFCSGRCQFIEDARFAPVVLFRTWLFLFRTSAFCSEPLGISGRFIQGILFYSGRSVLFRTLGSQRPVHGGQYFDSCMTSAIQDAGFAHVLSSPGWGGWGARLTRGSIHATQ